MGPYSECSYFMPGAHKSLRYAKRTAGVYMSFCSSCPFSLHSMKVVDSAVSGQNREEQKIRSQCTHFLYRWAPHPPQHPFYCCFVTSLILSLGYSVSYPGAWKRLYILSCSYPFLNTLIVPTVKGEQAERDLPRASWGDACHGCVWMMEFVRAERLLKVLWLLQREKASVKSWPEKHLLCGVGWSMRERKPKGESW